MKSSRALRRDSRLRRHSYRGTNPQRNAKACRALILPALWNRLRSANHADRGEHRGEADRERLQRQSVLPGFSPAHVRPRGSTLPQTQIDSARVRRNRVAEELRGISRTARARVGAVAERSIDSGAVATRAPSIAAEALRLDAYSSSPAEPGSSAPTLSTVSCAGHDVLVLDSCGSTAAAGARTSRSRVVRPYGHSRRRREAHLQRVQAGDRLPSRRAALRRDPSRDPVYDAKVNILGMLNVLELRSWPACKRNHVRVERRDLRQCRHLPVDRYVAAAPGLAVRHH